MIVPVIIAGFLGFWLGGRKTTAVGLEHEFIQISRAELKEYESLKDEKQKFEKANEILAKVMQLFVADLGLRIGEAPACRLDSNLTPKINAERLEDKKSEPPPPPLPSPPQKLVAETQAPPAAAAAAATSPPPEKKSGATTDSNNPRNWRSGGITPEKVKNAAHALYQAILWRAPDEKAIQEFTQRMTESGWSAYTARAKRLFRSREFSTDVAPNHQNEKIINRVFAIFLGRCAFKPELERASVEITRRGHAEVLTDVIQTARRRNPDQILAGGYPVTSCAE